MKTKKQFLRLVVVITLFTFLVGSNIAYGFVCEGSGKGRKGGPSQDILRELDLSKEQKDTLQEQRHNFQVQRIELRSKLEVKELELQHELGKADTDTAKINTLVKEIGSLKEDLLRSRVDSVLSMKKVLTSEQYEKFQELKETRHMERKGDQGFFQKARKMWKEGVHREAPLEEIE